MSDCEVIQREITDEDIKNWEPLDKDHKSPMDCVINVFSFFKIIDNNDIAKGLSNLKNTTQNATFFAEMNFFLEKEGESIKMDIEGNNNAPTKKFELIECNNDTELKSVIEKIKPKHGIIGLIKGNDPVGHAIIVARYSNGKLCILDPQQDTEKFVGDIVGLNAYLIFSGFKHFSTICSKDIEKNNNKITGIKRLQSPNKIRKTNEYSNTKKKQKTKENSTRGNNKTRKGVLTAARGIVPVTPTKGGKKSKKTNKTKNKKQKNIKFSV